MKYISTRGGIEPISFTEAVMMGLASDGGLLLPETIPDVSDKLTEWRTLPYSELAHAILARFVGEDIAPDDLRQLITKSYSTFACKEIVPIVPVNDLFIMELFHGPTLAFKDVALQLLGNQFEYILERDDRRLNILGATSGDTGSAAIAGVRGKGNMNIFILHPYKKISPIQERQMTTILDENVFNIAIKGSFDDGQRIIKSLFNDLKFKEKYALGAVNSVNWARVAAQIVYYFYGALRVSELTGQPRIRVCVPTGNFGNIFAGYLAMKMGAPISQLILAANENDILATFFQTGNYRRGSVQETYSPSMDIQIASNFERYLYYYVNQDSEKLRSLMQNFTDTGSIVIPAPAQGAVDSSIMADRASNEETLETIRTTYHASDYLVDPHTAVGVSVCRKHTGSSEPTLCLATAHAAKFGDVIKLALGYDAAHHDSINKLHDLPTRCEILPATDDAVRSFIKHSVTK